MGAMFRSLAAICECRLSRPESSQAGLWLQRCTTSEPLSSGRMPEELIAQFSADYLAYRVPLNGLKLPSPATLAHFPAKQEEDTGHALSAATNGKTGIPGCSLGGVTMIPTNA